MSSSLVNPFSLCSSSFQYRRKRICWATSQIGCPLETTSQHRFLHINDALHKRDPTFYQEVQREIPDMPRFAKTQYVSLYLIKTICRLRFSHNRFPEHMFITDKLMTLECHLHSNDIIQTGLNHILFNCRALVTPVLTHSHRNLLFFLLHTSNSRSFSLVYISFSCLSGIIS